MTKPRFWQSLWHMALLMLLAYGLLLGIVRGSWSMPLIFSGIPLAGLLDSVIYKPLLGMIPSNARLEAAMWLMIVASYVQWTVLGALLAYVWEVVRYRRALSRTEHASLRHDKGGAA